MHETEDRKEGERLSVAGTRTTGKGEFELRDLW